MLKFLKNITVSTWLGVVFGAVSAFSAVYTLWPKKFNQSYLDIRFKEFQPSMSLSGSLKNEGVYVLSLSEEYSSNEYGLQIGDLIRSANGQSVKSVEDIQRIISSISAGSEIPLLVVRAGKYETFTVKTKDSKGDNFVWNNFLNISNDDLNFVPKYYDLARKTKLGFYDSAEVWEFFNSQGNCISSYLINKSSTPIFLNGESAKLLNFNSNNDLNIENINDARNYLSFFASNAWGENGPFLIKHPRRKNEVSNPSNNDTFLFKGTEDKENYIIQTWLVYSNNLSEALFYINKKSHAITMKQEKFIKKVSRKVEYKKGFRCLKEGKLFDNNLNIDPPFESTWTLPNADRFHDIRQLIIMNYVQNSSTHQ